MKFSFHGGALLISMADQETYQPLSKGMLDART